MPETKLTEDEIRAMNEARRASQEMIRRVGQPGDNFILVDNLPAADDERVLMMVPRAFFLTLVDHRRIKFPIGVSSVPVRVKIGTPKAGQPQRYEAISEHWYVKSHDCRVYSAGAPMSRPAPVGLVLLGSDELPAIVRIAGEKREITEFILAAQLGSGLSIAEWNALSEDDRRHKIIAKLDEAAWPAKEGREGEEAPLGSATLQDHVAIGQNKTPIGVFVDAAHKRSALPVDAWNALPEEKRDELISAEIELAKASAQK